jgi:hypothetical protein
MNKHSQALSTGRLALLPLALLAGLAAMVPGCSAADVIFKCSCSGSCSGTAVDSRRLPDVCESADNSASDMNNKASSTFRSALIKTQGCADDETTTGSCTCEKTDTDCTQK